MEGPAVSVSESSPRPIHRRGAVVCQGRHRHATGLSPSQEHSTPRQRRKGRGRSPFPCPRGEWPAPAPAHGRQRGRGRQGPAAATLPLPGAAPIPSAFPLISNHSKALSGPRSDLHKEGAGQSSWLQQSDLETKACPAGSRIPGKHTGFVMEMRGEERARADERRFQGGAGGGGRGMEKSERWDGMGWGSHRRVAYLSSAFSGCQLSHATALSHSNQHMPLQTLHKPARGTERTRPPGKRP